MKDWMNRWDKTSFKLTPLALSGTIFNPRYYERRKNILLLVMQIGVFSSLRDYITVDGGEQI